MVSCLLLTENSFLGKPLTSFTQGNSCCPQVVLTMELLLEKGALWGRKTIQRHWSSPMTSNEQTNLQPTCRALFPWTVASKTRIVNGFRGAAQTPAELMEKKHNPWSYSSKYKHLGKQMGSVLGGTRGRNDSPSHTAAQGGNYFWEPIFLLYHQFLIHPRVSERRGRICTATDQGWLQTDDPEVKGPFSRY